MRSIKINNPFPIVGYWGEKYFCDREYETQRLLKNINSGVSTTLISIRRMGKTGLIHHVIKKLPTTHRGIYVDILSTENTTDFLNKLSTSIVRSVPEKSSFGKKIWQIIKNFRPLVQFDSLTGLPQITFELKPEESKKSIETILQLLEKQEIKTVIAIDEFQQITSYPEKNIDAWLRTIMQELKNVIFIFSGSQQHVMTHLFVNPSRPFFRSTSILKLNKIEKDIYIKFIINHFAESGKKLSEEIATEMIEWANIHTFYVQLLCNRVFETTQKNITSVVWKKQASLLLKEQEIVFFSYRNLLTTAQWNLLKAIASQGKVYEPTAQKFISDNQLGTSAGVLRALKSLSKYELIYNENNEEGKNYYSIYDVLFQRWCQQKKM